MAGIDRETKQPLDGWGHIAQSIQVILTTPIGTRVMRREFGSWVPYLVDAPATQENLTRVFVAIATALDIWEPRFVLQRVEVPEAEAGRLVLDIHGIEIIDGHLNPQDQRRREISVRVSF